MSRTVYPALLPRPCRYFHTNLGPQNWGRIFGSLTPRTLGSCPLKYRLLQEGLLDGNRTNEHKFRGSSCFCLGYGKRMGRFLLCKGSRSIPWANLDETLERIHRQLDECAGSGGCLSHWGVQEEERPYQNKINMCLRAPGSMPSRIET